MIDRYRMIQKKREEKRRAGFDRLAYTGGTVCPTGFSLPLFRKNTFFAAVFMLNYKME